MFFILGKHSPLWTGSEGHAGLLLTVLSGLPRDV